MFLKSCPGVQPGKRKRKGQSDTYILDGVRRWKFTWPKAEKKRVANLETFHTFYNLVGGGGGGGGGLALEA